MNNESSKTINHLSIINNHFALGSSTFVEMPLQIHPFLQNKAKSRKAQMNVTSYMKSRYEKRTLGERGKTKPKQTQNKPKQTQFPPQKPASTPKTNPNKPKTNPIFKDSAPLLTGLNYFLFCEHFSGQIIGKGYFRDQGLLVAGDFVGYVKGQSVINGYQCGEPELFQLIRFYLPPAEQCLAVLFVQVPELDIYSAGCLYYIAFFIDWLDVDNQLFLFAVFVFIVKISIFGNLDFLEVIEAFEPDFRWQMANRREPAAVFLIVRPLSWIARFGVLIVFFPVLASGFVRSLDCRRFHSLRHR
jgi:hypothetical protein